MEGIIAIAAPFAMVVAIVWIVQQGKSRRVEMSRGGSREDAAVMGAMQAQIEKLASKS